MLASKGADGFIFLGQGAGDGWLKELARTDVPFVVWGAVDDRPHYCTVGSDNRKGGRLVGERFAQLGRRRVLFLGARSHPEMGHRRDGLEEGLRAAAGKARISDLDIPDFTFETGFAVGRRLLDDRAAMPDAIFAASDSVAMGLIVALREGGVDIPAEVSVIGYNDIPAAAHFILPLTTVRQDTQQAGSLLVEKLFQLLDGARPRSTKLPTELVIRQS
jgi:DNA-binding LacI/PurR family transcriptional regulator